MAAQYWLVKSEPSAYSWNDLQQDKKTAWTGVRNFQARNFLRAMKKGDAVLFYHSVTDKEVVGIARVEREAYADPTAKEGDWSCVDLAPAETLRNPVSLEQIKGASELANIGLLKQSRLSVMPLAAAEYRRILQLAKSNNA